MLNIDDIKKELCNNCVASRIGAGDASLYDFDDEAELSAENFMGWVNLGSKPPVSAGSIQTFAKSVLRDGIDTILLLGQGGSTQAPMTITKYNKENTNVRFRIIDSVSPVRVREFLETSDPFSTLILVSSKSGGTIEPNSLLLAIKEAYLPILGDELYDHLVAITDPGSSLEVMAKRENWRKIFNGVPEVGGRYSALSVFGLVPAALTGIDVERLLDEAANAELECRSDVSENPAIDLAAFMYANYISGRNKFSFLTPKKGRVLGLWIEQLIAESLGKQGQGITPNIELDSLLLASDTGDRYAITYDTETDLIDEQDNFELSLKYIDKAIPCKEFEIDTVYELGKHFVMWEYACAMCGYLMKVCPFDQPDVQSTKTATLQVLDSGLPDIGFTEVFVEAANMGMVRIVKSDALSSADTLHDSLKALLMSINKDDYFSINAFLPFCGEGRREALDSIRTNVSRSFGVMSCLEIGPRFLHSTGQLQKGGPNNGVFLVLSADELNDIELKNWKASSLGQLARAQATGDMQILSERGRRALHLHLPNNTGCALRLLKHVIYNVIDEIYAENGTH